MRYILTLLLPFFLLNPDLLAQGGNQKIKEVSLTSHGQMGNIKYNFTSEKFKEKKTASGVKDSSINKNPYWESIIKTIREIELDSLNFFKAPTNLRVIDGDWHSYITIITKSQTYRTPNFDSSNPNKELIQLDSILWASGHYLSTINWDSLYSLREEDEVNIDKVYQIVDERPTFKGGKDSLKLYIIERLNENGINTGKAFVRFIVRKDGQLDNLELIKTDTEVMGKIAISIVTGMPNWEAGKNGGEPVDVQVVIPIGYDIKNP